MKNTPCYNKYKQEGKEPDSSAEKITKAMRPELKLVDVISGTEENFPSSIKSDDEDSEFSCERESRDCNNHPPGISSSLTFYCKSINKFPLLNEEEEKKLAKQIKTSEENFMHLIIQWRNLFKKNF